MTIPGLYPSVVRTSKPWQLRSQYSGLRSPNDSNLAPHAARSCYPRSGGRSLLHLSRLGAFASACDLRATPPLLSCLFSEPVM